MASKAQRKQDAELRRMRSTGPYTCSTIATTTAGNWCRSSLNTFDYNFEGNYIALIDAQLARAEQFGQVANSQFGYGIYDVRISAMPTSAVNPFNTNSSVGKVRLTHVQPSPMVFDALRELKKLEAWDDNQDAVTMNETGGNHSHPEVSPLLTMPIDWDEDSEGAGVASLNPTKGSKIIRFGYDESTMDVKYQSSFTVNLNPHSDDDVSDNYEKQKYTLMGYGDDHFGVLMRYEDHINPVVDDGVRRIEREWAYPMTDKLVARETRVEQPMFYSHNYEEDLNIIDLEIDWAYETQDQLAAEFKNVRAVGGLIKVGVPDWYSRFEAGNNNDFQLQVELTCKKWVPMA